MTLEEFVDKGIEIGIKHGYHPTVFYGMRDRYGTRQAIERLVITSDNKIGFTRMKDLGLLE